MKRDGQQTMHIKKVPKFPQTHGHHRISISFKKKKKEGNMKSKGANIFTQLKNRTHAQNIFIYLFAGAAGCFGWANNKPPDSPVTGFSISTDSWPKKSGTKSALFTTFTCNIYTKSLTITVMPANEQRRSTPVLLLRNQIQLQSRTLPKECYCRVRFAFHDFHAILLICQKKRWV